MQSDRSFKTDLVQRDRATLQTKADVASWTRWEAGSGEPFEIHYDQTVSFCVVEGRARIAFSDGTHLDIERDDFVTIKPHIKGVWTVLEPITNLYRYHGTDPAAT